MVLLVHLPPVVPSLKVVLCKAQIVVIPVIGNGLAFTEITVVAVHPAPNEYVMIVVPMLTPQILPLDEPIVATVTSVLVQLPPLTASASVRHTPVHTFGPPAIAVAVGFTVTICVTMQPVGKAYVIIDVPKASAVTRPLVIFIFAIVGLLLIQVPPGTTSE